MKFPNSNPTTLNFHTNSPITLMIQKSDLRPWPESLKHPMNIKKGTIGVSRKRKLAMIVTEDIREKLSRKIDHQVERVKWDRLTLYDIKNWPNNIPMRNPKMLSTKELEYLMSKLKEIYFGGVKIDCEEGIRRMKVNIIVRELNSKLSKALNRNMQRIRWDIIEKYGLTGWPDDVPVKNPRHLSITQLNSVLERIEADEIGFSIPLVHDLELDATEALLLMQTSFL